MLGFSIHAIFDKISVTGLGQITDEFCNLGPVDPEPHL